MVSKSQKLMIADGAPASIVLLTPKQRKEAWKGVKVTTPVPFVPQTKALDPEAQVIADDIKLKQKQRSLTKLQNFLKRKKEGRGTKKIDHSKMRWNPRICQFVPDTGDFAPTHPLPDDIVTPTNNVSKAASVKVTARKAAKQPAPVPDSVTPHTIRAFAIANGCWDPKYDQLPNPGLVRMSVGNRLRAKVAKGHKVVMP